MKIMGITCALIGILLVYTSTPAHARPQNGVVEADGFVFNGPADRPDSFPNNIGRTPPSEFPPLDPTESTATTSSPEIAQCMQNCPVTAQYNPVCGSNNVVYSNMGKLNCAISCGLPITFRYFGQCSSNIRGK